MRLCTHDHREQVTLEDLVKHLEGEEPGILESGGSVYYDFIDLDARHML